MKELVEENKLEEGMCPHRHEITFSFTVTGFGDTKEEAIQEARDYAIKDWIKYNSVQSFDVVKAVYANDQDTCDTCEEEE